MDEHEMWTDAQKAAIEEVTIERLAPLFHDLVAELLLRFAGPMTLTERMSLGSAVMLCMFKTVIEAWVREEHGEGADFQVRVDDVAEDLIQYTARWFGVYAGVRAQPLPPRSRGAVGKRQFHAIAMGNVHKLMCEVAEGCSQLQGAEEEQGALTLYGGLGAVMAARYIRDKASAHRWLEGVIASLGFQNPEILVVPQRR